MYPRLKVAKELLSEDGVIFISIDDNEQENFKKICDEIFGRQNFISNIVWEKVHTRKNSAINFSSSHEYIICYAKVRRNNSGDTVGFKRNLLPRENTDAYSNPDNDPKGPWKTDPITAHNYYAADYTITKPNGVIIHRPQDRYWAYSEESIKRMIEENAIVWGEGNSIPMAKRYLCDVQDGFVPKTLFSREFAGDTSQAKKQIDNLFKECKGIFDYTKPTKLIARLLQIGTNSEDIVLDFFSGSGTTADSIMQLNAEDGGHRKYIMVQLQEETDEKSEAYKAGYKNICEIGKERIRRAAKKIHENNPEAVFDDGFKVFEVADTNIRWNTVDDEELTLLGEVNYDTDEKDRIDFVNGSNDIDIVYEIMLRQYNISLTTPIEKLSTVSDRTYIFADSVVVCLESEINDELIEKLASIEPTPNKFVLRDSAFSDNIELKDVSFRKLSALIANHQIKEEFNSNHSNYTVEFI